MSELLPKYSFLPWLRKGISNEIDLADNLGSGVATIAERVNIDLKVKVLGDGNLVDTIDTTVKLVGPGDVIGIHPNAIIKTEPENWITNFEPNYFPYIEFYDEDFPWRYTPASPTPTHKLRPWFVLVVLKQSEFEKQTSIEGLLPSIKLVETDLTLVPFPKHDETWAWAHVHVNGDLYTGTPPLDPDNIAHVQQGLDRMAELVKENPDLAIARMICPRKLESNTDYYAFLIPAFETGRLAGLGIEQSEIATIDAQLPSWGLTSGIHNSLHQPNKWPVYHEYYFKTGSTGDFEYLVRQIVPRTLDPKVGKRPIDIQDPGYLLSYPVGDGTVELEGALRIPGNAGAPYPWSSDPDATTYRQDVADLVNLGENIIDSTFADTINTIYTTMNIGGANVSEDPIVAPPLYGRWHALKRTVDTTNNTWIHELNIDPRSRAVAGIGTEVIRKNQDKFMDQAWEQVGAVIEANKKLKWAQVSKEVSHAMFKRHILAQPLQEKVALTSKFLKKVKAASGDTIYKQAKDSILPTAVASRAFRKIRRTNGPLMRRIDKLKAIGTSVGASHIMARMADNAAPIQAAAEKIIAVSATKTAMSDMETVIGFAAAIDNTSYLFDMTDPEVIFTPAPDNAIAESFKEAISVFEAPFAAVNWQSPATPSSFDLAQASLDIDDKTNPLKALPVRVYHPGKLEFSVPFTPPADKIVPILAAPAFKQPMYEAVRDMSTDLLIPNLNLITQNTISLLETNQKFIESYMVGINHEMGRELLWREYPTDQRGTYFKHFWDATDFVDTTDALTAKQLEDKVGDIIPIHTWLSTTALGTHNNRSTDGGTTSEAKLVLVIRGDLLKKYPGAVIYAQRAKWDLNSSEEHDYSKPRLLDTDQELYPIFGAKINPDINFIGFNLTACEAKGDEIVDENAPHNSYDPGYFFIIKERPGELRFGLDIEDTDGDPSPDTWNDVRWDHVTTANDHVTLAGGTISPGDDKIPASTGLVVKWSTNSTAADLAMATFQNPVLVAIHAKEMLDIECP
jgi:hypothetical protein